jgi:hypothetical protein
VKPIIVLYFGITLFATSAQAGLFDLWPLDRDLKHGYSRSPDWIQAMKARVLEVPVANDCRPAFVPGDDGIFYRTSYCHRANPNKPSGFLAIGYDVPASFLAGFTEKDVFARWESARLEHNAPHAYDEEAPSELFLAMNVVASRAWERMLSCVAGDADRARDQYRLGFFDCSENEAILTQLADLRSSVLTLATSVEMTVLLDNKTIYESLRQHLLRVDDRIQEQEKALELDFVLRRERDHLDQLQRRISSLLQDGKARPELYELLEGFAQRLPRLHPLLVQIMVEEVLALVGPTESPRRAAKDLEKNNQNLKTLIHLLVWLRSIEKGSCSALGLWPSANRTAIEAFGDRVIEIWHHLGGPNQVSLRIMDQVACPWSSAEERAAGQTGEGSLASRNLNLHSMRLNDVYFEGRLKTWAELLEVREHYTKSDPR